MFGWLKALIIRYQTPLVSALVGIVILSSAGLYLTDLSTVQQFYKETAIHNATKYADDAEAAIKSGCIEPTAIRGNPDCIRATEHVARQNQRDEFYLYSQRTMSLWNEVMGKAAVLGIAIGLVSAWLIFVTFKATRVAAESSTNTYRAYLKVESAKLIVSPQNHTIIEGRRHVILNVSNIGRSDAVISSFSTAWQADDKFDTTKAYLGHLTTKHIKASTIVQLAQIPFSAEYPEARYLRGIVVYSSSLDKRQVHHFSFEVNAHVGDDDIQIIGPWVRDAKGDDWPDDT